MPKASSLASVLFLVLLAAAVAGAATPDLQLEQVLAVDRVAAVDGAGNGYVWHQINACGEVVFDGNPVPENCPPVPESLN